MRLIDADALKAHIDKLPALPDGNFIAEGRPIALMPRWIPVTERLPGIDDGDWVLGVVNGFAHGIVYKNAIVTVEYYENSGCWSLHDSDAKVTVTHWMPLPELPEEVTP